MLSGIISSHTLSLILSEIQVFLSQEPANFPLLYILGTRPCLWDLLLFLLSNNDRINKKISPLPQPGCKANVRGSEKDQEDLHSPFNLLRLTVPQEFLHLLPAALLVFWVFCKVVQDPGEAAGCGIMA